MAWKTCLSCESEQLVRVELRTILPSCTHNRRSRTDPRRRREELGEMRFSEGDSRPIGHAILDVGRSLEAAARKLGDQERERKRAEGNGDARRVQRRAHAPRLHRDRAGRPPQRAENDATTGILDRILVGIESPPQPFLDDEGTARDRERKHGHGNAPGPPPESDPSLRRTHRESLGRGQPMGDSVIDKDRRPALTIAS